MNHQALPNFGRKRSVKEHPPSTNMTATSFVASKAAAMCKGFRPCSLQDLGMPMLKAMRTESALWVMDAISSAVRPMSFLAVASARLPINTCTTSATLTKMAKTMGRSPTLVITFASAPPCRSTEAAAAWPCKAAMCRGRMPANMPKVGKSRRSLESKDALLASNALMTSTLPAPAAISKGLVPCGVSVAEVKWCAARNASPTFSWQWRPSGCSKGRRLLKSAGKPLNKLTEYPSHRRYSRTDPDLNKCSKFI
mmetsp:Transcript_127673/g.369620  ORF Transcript_127673/g.369620 Transcript_127673/m.369620 type:complete len:253 (+) Transcript_127673:56-814(+)